MFPTEFGGLWVKIKNELLYWDVQETYREKR